MSTVLVPPRPSSGAPPRGPREPHTPDPLDAADVALAKVRATLRDANEDEFDTGRHEIHVTVNTAPTPAPRAPQPSVHELDEYVQPTLTLPKALGALATVAGAVGAVGKALGWF
jgi:hypothetical protein